MHILPFSKYQRRKKPLRKPKMVALLLTLLLICYSLRVLFGGEPKGRWHARLYRKETRETFVKEWDGVPVKVAVLLGVTSRGQKKSLSITNTKLFEHCLPGIVRTAGYDAHNFVVYIAIDRDDAYLTTPANLAHIRDFEAPRNIRFNPVVVSGGTFVKAINEVARIAYRDGMQYFLRINADSELLTPRWATLGIRALQNMNRRNVGVIGPLSYNDRPDIFTHDMTSRAHLEIFNGNYYPRVFSNWYIDDWISRIYGKNATVRMQNFHILHHEEDESKERQYTPDFASEVHLVPQVREAKLKIRRWVQQHESLL